MPLKKYFALAMLATSFVWACNVMQTEAMEISTNHLSHKLEVVAANQKTLFLNGEQEGLQKHILNLGSGRANIYTVLYKDNSDYRFGLLGDVQVTPLLLNTLALQNGDTAYLNSNKNGVDRLATYLTNYVKEHSGEYKFAEPTQAIKGAYVTAKNQGFVYDKAENAYYAFIVATYTRQNVLYNEVIHCKVYNAKYYGPSVRFVVTNRVDDRVLWPLLSETLT